METLGLKRRRGRRGSQGGFGMIELLIAAVILAVGALGLAALEVSATGVGSQSRSLGTATLLAHSLLDRIVAEGNLSQAERFDSQNGTITSTGWVFIDPTGLTAATSTAANNQAFDIQGNPTAVGSANAFFTLTWQRLAGTTAGNLYAYQPFIVNVQWNEPLARGNGTRLRYFSASRNVRL
jgi:type IV pilus modification protein PilV